MGDIRRITRTKVWWLSAFLLAFVGLPTIALSMESMDEASLAAVTGKNAAVFDLEFRMNANADGSQIGSCGQSSPSPIAFANGYSGTNNLCSAAVQFNNRAGEWLVLNGFSFVLKVNGLKFDGVKIASVSDNSSKFRAAAFQNQQGACLLLGVSCTASNLGQLYALRFSPQTPSVATNTPQCSSADCTSVNSAMDAYYKDLRLGLKVNRVTILTGSNVPTDANPGNVVTINMGNQVGAVQTDLAKATWQGNILIYGF